MEVKEIFQHVHWLDVGRVVTTCSLINGKYEPVAAGIAVCCPLDKYNRKLGNRIARGRAYKALALRTNLSPVAPNHAAFIPHTHKGIYFEAN